MRSRVCVFLDLMAARNGRSEREGEVAEKIGRRLRL
jgi:hypothetical protein